MNQEILDIWSPWGEKTAEKQSRKKCHEQGLWHQTVHIWVLNSDNQLLLQQRQLDRESNPGKWDISAAGHIPSGQSALEAAQRELDEEIGLDIHLEELEYLGRVKHVYQQGSSWINREFQEIYMVKNDKKIESFQFQKEEVNALRWIDLHQFWKWVDQSICPWEDHAQLVSHPREYALMKDVLSHSKHR